MEVEAYLPGLSLSRVSQLCVCAVCGIILKLCNLYVCCVSSQEYCCCKSREVLVEGI